MAKIKDILRDEDMKSAEKLTLVQDIVETARKMYGNEDVTINVPDVNTTAGMKSLKYLSDDSKVAVASTAFDTIVNIAIEAHTDTQGMMLDREIESLIACDPILVNLAATTGSTYL